MTRRVPFNLRTLLLSTAILLMTACATGGPESLAPTASGPRPSPKPAFTGLALPATLPAPVPTPTSSARTQALTILYTNDTRGYVDPCG